jgi:hypothetical protein
MFGIQLGVCVFRSLLHFIYTDSLPEIDDRDRTAMAQHLLVAADQYGMERLKSICEYVLNLTPFFFDTSAVVTTLVLAEHHGCHQLKEAILKSHTMTFDIWQALAPLFRCSGMSTRDAAALFPSSTNERWSRTRKYRREETNG